MELDKMYRVKITHALDFVKVTGGDIDYWNNAERDDWSEGCEEGRRRAADLLTFMGDQGDPSLLGRVGKAITMSGRFGSVETGFFHQIAANLI
ncbi:hypothetical protein D3C80_1463990 [compost metagenome]